CHSVWGMTRHPSRDGRPTTVALRGRARALSGAPPQLGLDESLDVAVQDRIDVPDLDARPVVLHQPVGMQDVGADLRAELDVAPLAAEVLDPLLTLAAGALGQTRGQDAHRHRPVLQLRALVLTDRRD